MLQISGGEVVRVELATGILQAQPDSNILELPDLFFYRLSLTPDDHGGVGLGITIAGEFNVEV